MVVVKVKAIILYRAETRHAKSKQRPDIGFSIFRCAKDGCSARLQDLRRRLKQRQVRGRCGHADADRVSRAQVAFYRGKVFRDVCFVIGSIGSPAGVAKFLVHPRNHPDRPPWMQAKLLDQLRRLHGYNNSRAIVDGPGAEVP